MANRDRVNEEPGMFGQREDHKAVIKVFMYTKMKEISYSPPPHDPRVMDFDYMGDSA